MAKAPFYYWLSWPRLKPGLKCRSKEKALAINVKSFIVSCKYAIIPYFPLKWNISRTPMNLIQDLRRFNDGADRWRFRSVSCRTEWRTLPKRQGLNINQRREGNFKAIGDFQKRIKGRIYLSVFQLFNSLPVLWGVAPNPKFFFDLTQKRIQKRSRLTKLFIENYGSKMPHNPPRRFAP